MVREMAKKKTQKLKAPESFLGLQPGAMDAATAERMRKVAREVWHQRSWQKKAALKRATDAEGFTHCERCRKIAPKVHVNHKTEVGSPDGGFLARLHCPPSELEVLCVRCHGAETYVERADYLR